MGYDRRNALLNHTHDDVYYTESELDDLLDAKLSLTGGQLTGATSSTSSIAISGANGSLSSLRDQATHGAGDVLRIGDNVVQSEWRWRCTGSLVRLVPVHGGNYDFTREIYFDGTDWNIEGKPIFTGMSITTLGNYANDAAAAGGGIAVGQLYRNGSIVMVRVA